MSATTQIPRVCIIWLLAAQSAVMLPHLQRLSWWMLAIWLLCAVWRLAMYRGEAAHPSVWLRSIVVALGAVGIAVSFGQQGPLDVAVAALIFAFSLKLIEVKQRRDLYLVFYLAFFVLAAAFLYSQSLPLVIYQVFASVIVFAGLVATQQSSGELGWAHAVRVTVQIAMQALPLLLVMFFLFPRIPPIWSVAESSSRGGTGMSESMSPGDVAKLSQSTELVFTAEFDGPEPPRRELYWRGMTYEYFDGRQWSRGSGSETAVESNGMLRSPLAALPVTLRGQPLQYEMTYPPNSNYWLFALPLAELDAPTASKSNTLALLQDFNYESRANTSSSAIWRVRSYLDFVAEPQLSTERLRELTALPEGYNPRSQQFARSMRLQSRDAHDFVNRLLRYLNTEPFYYSLDVPTLGEHSVDDFFFNTRQGFCEHYANAAAFMLRSAGIPTRIVAGYQGGDSNPVNGTLSVRQLDAHVWIEYWQVGEGWQRVDPTAAVSPARVELGLSEALRANSEQGLAPYGALRLYELGWMKNLRQRLDALNYAWQRAFVGFNYQSQASLLQHWLGELSVKKMGILAAVASAICLGLLALMTLLGRRDKPQRREDKLYAQFCAKLGAAGFYRGVAEAPSTYAARVSAVRPDLAEAVQRITCLYQQIVFQELGQRAVQLELARQVRAFRAAKAPVAIQ